MNNYTTSNSSSTSVDFSVILVCWNNKNYLDNCLASLYAASVNYTYDVSVVDNGSTDGSQVMLAAKYPDVKLIRNDQNLGLGKATNQGIQATRGRYAWLLNNDTLVNDDSINTMVDFLENNPKVGAVGGTLLNSDGYTQATYGKFSNLVQEFLIATRLGSLIWPTYPDHGKSDVPKSVDWVSSACLMVRRTALNQVGLLDEEYFIYGDEADLQYRLKKNGWEVYYLPQVKTIHYGGRSMNRWSRRKMVYRGKMLFYKKNYGLLRMVILRALLGGLSLLKILIWGIGWFIPRWRKRAQRELRSNWNVAEISLVLK